ncbi:SDR family NAD(P)-dependent oxidoreductase [Salinicoccus roseus]|uniref:Diacetyl reductase [(S)-acetoin forming] n=1 Tax=Salinicoccus roseus TaxID=45670 RepID=A0A0C2E6E3_9STAP|nr:SDR family NAD(P)-dependent oxidoreductase [Salinicoccus roseus]KIH70872.1 oxidoreductase [Salinicoccus roseus]MDB0580531.1 SDR family NAD(P)-dependent oxidoreductase [Salinicoccus roseus]
MGKLENKVAVITGGAGGLGKQTAQTFLNEGAKVSLVDLDKSKLDTVRKELGSDNIISIEADVTNEDDVKNYVEKTVDEFGSIDVFFNNAGIIGDIAPIDEQSLDNFNKVVSINATGVFLGLKHIIPVMKKQKNGSIINTSSVDGLRGSPNLSPYSTSKHAVVGLTKTAALENSEFNIRVNSVHPAPVTGNMMQTVEKGLSESQQNEEAEVKEALTESVPLGRYAESADIANVVLFLASDDSKFVTGSQYRVDGGMGATS